MAGSLTFEPFELPPETAELRREVRAFLTDALPKDLLPNSDNGAGRSPEFSRKIGERGWIGMTWPKRYGGGERSFLDRYVVTEEMLAAGAPVGSHWAADRQIGPSLLRHGTEEQRQYFIPRMARGECFFSIGMSEPDSGSDLASVRTRGVPVDGGWLVNGAKIWSSGAHQSHYMLALIRTDPEAKRREGLTQVIIDLRATEGVKVRPIRNMAGDHDFNEVVFTDYFVPDDRVVGTPGNGWAQVTSELGYERSGPERFLSAFRVFVELVRAIGPEPDAAQAAVIGRISSHLLTLRKMSISVAGMLGSGRSVTTEAALVKELGNRFEQELVELARLNVPRGAGPRFRQTLGEAMLHAPSFSIRGGTREILRNMIARELGLR